eukprot:gb/GEZN01021124.1/.p1 GENE.gb/GEZN01021124.1/~~gb/GEZN01021124.1/.p1  ORF type:complete len:210 (+),score=29.75 gb/GEZN01021124.1/:22-651(+)
MAAVELSKSVSDGLLLFNDPKLFPEDQTFQSFLAIVFSEACQSSSSPPSPVSSVAFKQCFASALSLALEAARQDADAKTEILQVLDDIGVSSERAKLFSTSFHKSKMAIRATLAKTGFAFDTVVGMDWRIDYYIKSDTLELARMPIYFITLRTKKGGGGNATNAPGGPPGGAGGGVIKKVHFTCNLQELQDLSAKLKDARNSVKSRLQQ